MSNVGSVINASGTVGLQSGSDTNINGSQVKGDKVVANVGGNLNIASLQDTNDYTAKNKNSGIELSTGIKTGTTGSIGSGKTNSTYASVTEQAGIFAGTGGFEINVGKNTDLKGAVIASEATPDKNKLSTDTLTFSDVKNKAEYTSSSTGINYASGKDAEGKDVAKKDQGLTPNIGIPASDDADSTTKSAIASGTVIIRSGDTAAFEKLSRDTANSLNALGKIFDKKTVQEKQELAKVFGEEAHKAVGDLGLEEGSPEKAAVDATVGGIMAQLGGGSFASGAASGGINQLVMTELAKIKDPALLQWASAVVGAAAAKLTGGSVQAGASIAASQTKNNCLNHRQQQELAVKLSKATSNEERLQILDEYQKLSEHQIETGIDPDTGKKFEVDLNTGKPNEAIEQELKDALNNVAIPGTMGMINYQVNSGGLNYNLATVSDYINNATQLRNSGITTLGDAALSKAIFDDLKSTFKIAQEPVPGLGLAAKVEVAVSTTSGSTMVLKGISKVGVCAIGSTVYDVYTDSKTYSGSNLAIAAAIDAGGTLVAAGAGALAVGWGAPVYAVVIGGVAVGYLINQAGSYVKQQYLN